MPNRRTILLTGLATVLAASPLLADTDRIEAVVHRDPDCKCCSKWIRHLQSNGFSVTEHRTKNLTAVRAPYAVPDDLEGCHVAEIQGMVVEGHVPAEEIKVALARRSADEDIVGISVPGMPVGSPGMEGSDPEPYEVILFGKSGRTTLSRWLAGKRQ